MSLPPYVPPAQQQTEHSNTVDSLCSESHETQTQSQVQQYQDDEVAKDSLEESSNEGEVESTQEQKFIST